MNPKYKIDEQIECDVIIGWVRGIYSLFIGTPKSNSMYIYAIEEPESEAIFYFSEEELS